MLFSAHKLNAPATEMPISTYLRFWSKVDMREPDDCWIWARKARAAGYGRMKIGPKKLESAHRLAYAIANGPIPRGQMVCHTCDVRDCCNPTHLFAGTSQDNARDAVAKGRFFRFLKGSAHPLSKLTEEQRSEIRSRWAAGTGSQRGMAREYGVACGTVRRVLGLRSY